MSIINTFAGLVWLFFSWLGTLANIPLRTIVDGYSATITNPFNDLVWNVNIPDSLFPTALWEWILDLFNVPTDFTVFGAFLMITAIVFVVNIFVGLFANSVT